MLETIKEFTIKTSFNDELYPEKVDNGLTFSEKIDLLEKLNPDSSYFYDVELVALYDILTYNGFTDDKIKKLLNVQYGNFIQFYYFEDAKMYCLEIGTR